MLFYDGPVLQQPCSKTGKALLGAVLDYGNALNLNERFFLP